MASGEGPADTDTAQPALPGDVTLKYHTAIDFEVSDRWLVDIGCPHVVVSEEHAQRLDDCSFDANAINFNTTNGTCGSTTSLDMSIPLLNDTCSACILPKTRSVLSAGGRNQMGYTIVWLAGNTRCWITPCLGKYVPLSMHPAIPYLEDDSRWEGDRIVMPADGLSNGDGRLCCASGITAIPLFGGCRHDPCTGLI